MHKFLAQIGLPIEAKKKKTNEKLNQSNVFAQYFSMLLFNLNLG
jgi:hypothetical protein